MRTDKYVIRGGAVGRDRLRLLSEVMGPFTRALFAEVGISAGSICLDVGCGGGDVAFELARGVGPTGRVVGVDFDEAIIDIAKREGAEQGLANVAFEVRDVTKWNPEEWYDVVYARFLLSHLASPEGVVAAMRRHLRPGGVIVVEDIDFRGHFTEPDCPAFNRYVEFYTNNVKSRGGDPHIGPRLPALLRHGGFEDVRMRLTQPVALQGGIKLLTCITLENIAEAVLEDDLATAEELRKTIEELYAFARDPCTVLGGPRVFQAWSRVPG